MRTIRICKTPSRLLWYILWLSLLHIISSEIRKDTDACLAITGAIRRTAKEKLYQELGSDSFENRHWKYILKLCSLFKISQNKSPVYLYSVIPQRVSPHITRNVEAVPLFDIRHSFCKILFFPSTTLERNNLNQELRNIKQTVIEEWHVKSRKETIIPWLSFFFFLLFCFVYLHHHKESVVHFLPSISIFYEDQNEELPLQNLSNFLCVVLQLWSKEKLMHRVQRVEEIWERPN